MVKYPYVWNRVSPIYWTVVSVLIVNLLALPIEPRLRRRMWVRGEGALCLRKIRRSFHGLFTEDSWVICKDSRPVLLIKPITGLCTLWSKFNTFTKSVLVQSKCRKFFISTGRGKCVTVRRPSIDSRVETFTVLVIRQRYVSRRTQSKPSRPQVTCYKDGIKKFKENRCREFSVCLPYLRHLLKRVFKTTSNLSNQTKTKIMNSK